MVVTPCIDETDNDCLRTTSDHTPTNVIPSSSYLHSTHPVRHKRLKNGTPGVWTPLIVPASYNPEDTDEGQEDPIIFSNPKSSGPLAQIINTHASPVIKDCPLSQLQRKAGHVPITTLFHNKSHRTRYDDKDDDDLDGATQIKRTKKTNTKIKRGKSLVYESVFFKKGEFSFPYRTYQPKVQIPFKVTPGATPQTAVVERLHRLYRRLNINAILKKQGVKYADLLPPPNYGEQNSRFAEETMWRNRSRISGVEKHTFIYDPNGTSTEYEYETEEIGVKQRRTSGGSGSSFTGSSGDSSSDVEDSFVGGNQKKLIQQRDEECGDATRRDKDTTSFQTSKKHNHWKTLFGSQFPLEFFDNDDFDIRSPKDWMNLRYDWQGNAKYPLPGKAYLPIPFDTLSLDLVSLSQLTFEILLDKSQRLQHFRKWLIKQRYKRVIQDTKVRSQPRPQASAGPYDSMNEIELAKLADRSSTITTLIEKKSAVVKRRPVTKEKTKRIAETEYSSLLNIYSGEGIGESDFDTLSSDSLSEEDFLSQFPKRADASTDETPLVPIKSASILPDIWSDSNSLEDLEGLVDSKTFADFDERGDEWFGEDDFHDALRKIDGDEKGSWSPDEDEYYFGSNAEFIFDYNKMKRVHNYNWKWIDVAVFQYDFDSQRYLVRTVLKPFLFAWVPKIYLCMDAEDPKVHTSRIRDAIERRHNFEAILRYNLYVDCLPVDNAPFIPEDMMRNIVLKLRSTPRLVIEDDSFELANKEVNLDYKRFNMNMLFDRITNTHPKHYSTWIQNPEYYHHESELGTDWHGFGKRVQECATSNFAYKCHRLVQKSVLYKGDPYAALSGIIHSTWEARNNRSYIRTREGNPLRLDNYIHHQADRMKETHDYMQTVWLESIVTMIKAQLGKSSRTWYNIQESEWMFFEASKVSKFLRLIKYMLQDTLRHMVLESLTAYVDEIRELTARCLSLEKNYEPSKDVKKSEFPPPLGMNPIWILELSFSHTGPTYTQCLRDIPVVLVQLVNTCIDSASGLPDILPMVMKNLLFGTQQTLFTISKDEVIIENLKEDLNHILKKALQFVDTYAQKYKYYMPIWNLNLEKFMAEWNSMEHITKEIKATVDFHVRHYLEIESEVPSVMEIGAFKVHVEPIRIELLERKKRLYVSILNSFATKLRKHVWEVRDECEEIETKLTYRSDDIEEVMELKHYLSGVDGVILRKDELLQKTMKDYELFERYNYFISDEDFESKWQAAITLKKVYRLIQEAVAWLDDDYDRLLRLQQSDLADLSDAIDLANLASAGLAAFVELEKAIETKQKVQKVWETVKDLQKQSALLNRRQTIFGLPPVQNEALERMIKEIKPFRFLWLTCADWLQTRNAVFNHPLDDVDLTSVYEITTNGLEIMKKCVSYFAKEYSIQHIAKEALHEIEEFKPLVPLVKTFKHPGLRQRHLQFISELIGSPIIFEKNQTFQSLLDQGIGDHIEEITQIAEDAMNELRIEHGLDKMEQMVNTFSITIENEETLGIRKLIPPKGIENILKTFMKVTDEFQQSAHRGPFQERLNTWEKKIHDSYDAIGLLKSVESNWIKLLNKKYFKEPKMELKLAQEFQYYAKMHRIWRRIVWIVKGEPMVLDCASDATTRSSMRQMQTLHTTIQELLSKKGLNSLPEAEPILTDEESSDTTQNEANSIYDYK